MARKKHHVEHPDERWLLTYADMITLLMALFMVLYAMSMVNKVKFQQLKLTLKDAFSSAVFTGGSSILDVGAAQSSQSQQDSETQGRDTPIAVLAQDHSTRAGQSTGGSSPASAQQAAAAQLEEARQDAQLEQAARSLRAAIARSGMARNAQVTIDERGLVIRLVTDRVLFDSGSYELRPALDPLLDTIAHTVNRLPNVVHVEGYTDAVPYSGPLGNLGLSGNRAAAVLEHLAADGFDIPAHDAASVGYGPTHPRVPNGPGGVAPGNRRVEIVIVRNQFPGAAEAPSPVGRPIGSDPVGLRP